ncbi:MAG: ABC transporter permease [Patescibacteria group bacterium]
MKLSRINGLIMRHLYLYKRSVPRLMDIFYWPIMELLLWGFISAFIDKLGMPGFNAVTVLLGAVIFWDLLAQSQRAVSVSFLEEVWEKNFLNIFVTPLRVSEFIASTFILAAIRIVLVTIVMAFIAFFFYKFNLFVFGFTLIPFMFNLLMFGSVLGLFTTAIILRYGTSAQVLAFGFIMLIQPFTAVFYPVSVLPPLLQKFSYLFPSTYVFEGMREVISTGTFSYPLFWGAAATNFVYAFVITWFFYRMFAYVKREGKLLRLD